MKCIIKGCEEERWINSKKNIKIGLHIIPEGSCYCKKHMDEKFFKEK